MSEGEQTKLNEADDHDINIIDSQMNKKKKLLDSSILQRGGVKEYEPNSNALQTTKINDFHKKYEKLITQERFERKKNLSVAEWLEDKKRAKVLKHCGKYLSSFGYNSNKENYLYPEEILFLVDIGAFELYYKELPLSVQECFHVLLNCDNLNLQKYIVYSKLARLGFILKRNDSNIKLHQCSKRKNIDSYDDTIKHIKRKKHNFEDANYINNEVLNNKWMKPFNKNCLTFKNKQIKWNYENVVFPDFGVKETICIEDKTLPFLKMVKGRQLYYNKSIKDNDMKCENYGCKLFQNTFNDWNSLKAFNNMSKIEIEEKLKNSKASILWGEDIKPLIGVNLVCDSYKFLKALTLKSRIIDSKSEDTLSDISIDFNVYKPNANFQKTDPGIPNLRLIITEQEKPMLSYANLKIVNKLYNECKSPIYIAVVSGGEVSFFSFFEINLPCL